MSTFPIEEARLRSSWVFVLISIIAVVGYGWALQRETVRVFRWTVLVRDALMFSSILRFL